MQRFQSVFFGTYFSPYILFRFSQRIFKRKKAFVSLEGRSLFPVILYTKINKREKEAELFLFLPAMAFQETRSVIRPDSNRNGNGIPDCADTTSETVCFMGFTPYLCYLSKNAALKQLIKNAINKLYKKYSNNYIDNYIRYILYIVNNIIKRCIIYYI